MNESDNQKIEPVIKPVEGEIIDKTATWGDLKRKWSEVRQTWHNGVARVKAARQEAREKRKDTQE